MIKYLVGGIIVGVAFFHSGFSQAQSVNASLSPAQAAAFCSSNATGGMTNIDLRMPNGNHLIGIVDCSLSRLAVVQSVEATKAAADLPAPEMEAVKIETTVLRNTGR